MSELIRSVTYLVGGSPRQVIEQLAGFDAHVLCVCRQGKSKCKLPPATHYESCQTATYREGVMQVVLGEEDGVVEVRMQGRRLVTLGVGVQQPVQDLER
jgi:hypothetical protein